MDSSFIKLIRFFVMDPERPDAHEALPSKSQLKRDARALLKLSREITELSPRALAALPLDEDLEREIEFARSIRSNVARKRQVQFVAKMMRSRDIGPLLEAMEASRADARQLVARHHRAESWRDLLIEQGDDALQEFLNGYQTSELQMLRQLIRNARREVNSGKPPASARKLFRLLRDMDTENTLPPPPD